MGLRGEEFARAFEKPWVSFAIIAGSATGSSWLNHLLADHSHPCITSADEILLENRTLYRMFRLIDREPARLRKEGAENGISRALKDIDEVNREEMRRRAATAHIIPGLQARMRGCPFWAGGVKFNALDRDVTDRNVRAVANELWSAGWRVIMLRRTNLLDLQLSHISREMTGATHCTHLDCDPHSLNVSIKLHCDNALAYIGAHTEGNERIEAPVRQPPWNSSDGRILWLEYERLQERDQGVVDATELLGFSASSACELKIGIDKRVAQTQREMIHKYDTLARCLNDSGHGRFLHPDYRPRSNPLPSQNESRCGSPAHQDGWLGFGLNPETRPSHNMTKLNMLNYAMNTPEWIEK